MVRGRHIGDSEVAISRIRNYVDRHLIIIRGGIMEVRVAFVKHIQRMVDRLPGVLADRVERARIAENVGGGLLQLFVERAARTPKREIENIGEAELAVVPVSARKITKTSEVVLPLPAAVANHVWGKRGPNSKTYRWRQMKIEDWQKVQLMLDTLPLYLQPNGRWIQLLEPYKMDGKRKIGFALILARDKANPERLVPVTFYRINTLYYRRKMKELKGVEER